MRVLSGIQPSGKLHLGNYFGMMKPALQWQERGEAFYFIANYHALTSVGDPHRLRQDTLDVAMDFLACGLDPSRTTFFRQSDVPAVTELAWLLSVVTPVGLLERCHSYKDKLARGMAPSHALFSYPVLMAADILIYQAHVVPVGRDQKQHVEVTRDLAAKFNGQYGPVFTVPEPSIQEDVAVVPGLDGQKMSKSYGNTIELFGDPRDVRARIMRIVTDSKELAEPKDPSRCNIFSLYRLFASQSECEEMAERYRAGQFGYGTAKKALFDAFEAYFAPLRRRRAELAAHPDYLSDLLRRGAERASAEADKTLRAARQAVGL